MADCKLKREMHYFVLTDYEIEEEYLRKMHKNGYKFVKVTIPGFYYFEPCVPEDVVYKLDFNPKDKNAQQDYVQMYKDYGWEYIQDLNEYSYFRKKTLDADCENDLEIFSDNASKLDMLKRIFTKRMLLIFCVFFLCVWPQAFRMVEMIQTNTKDPFDVARIILWSVLFAAYIGLIGRCLVGFYRLKKKYTQNM